MYNRREEHNAKVELAMEWFKMATPEQQANAARELFDHAIRSEWVGVWSPEDQKELSEEEGRPIEEYRVPYLRTCGEPISGRKRNIT